ncbi:MAG: 3-dehydroquinate dehydratase, partial [Gemmatimonadetes bacterium]|nr:3-dehydroquinate dehydratase [Gemmatimonadota bacterium]
RRHSLLADIAVGIVSGFGSLGYLLAFDAMVAHVKSREG